MAEFDFRQGKDIFLHSTASVPAPGPTQPLNQWVPAAFSSEVKRPRTVGNHSPPSSEEVKNGAAIPPFPQKPSWRGAQLIYKVLFLNARRKPFQILSISVERKNTTIWMKVGFNWHTALDGGISFCQCLSHTLGTNRKVLFKSLEINHKWASKKKFGVLTRTPNCSNFNYMTDKTIECTIDNPN
jgi:hypothetical protein